jgi:hypothetical protein
LSHFRKRKASGDYAVMPSGCEGCKHFRQFYRFRKLGFSKFTGWCLQASDGYSGDCLLVAKTEGMSGHDELDLVTDAWYLE